MGESFNSQLRLLSLARAGDYFMCSPRESPTTCKLYGSILLVRNLLRSMNWFLISSQLADWAQDLRSICAREGCDLVSFLPPSPGLGYALSSADVFGSGSLSLLMSSIQSSNVLVFNTNSCAISRVSSFQLSFVDLDIDI